MLAINIVEWIADDVSETKITGKWQKVTNREPKPANENRPSRGVTGKCLWKSRNSLRRTGASWSSNGCCVFLIEARNIPRDDRWQTWLRCHIPAHAEKFRSVTSSFWYFHFSGFYLISINWVMNRTWRAVPPRDVSGIVPVCVSFVCHSFSSIER